MRKLSLYIAGLMYCIWGLPLVLSEESDWHKQPVSISTPWAEQVDPQSPLPEYPRPEQVRKDWKSLNGLWEYKIVSKTEDATLISEGKILVPFPIESSLSGVQKTVGPENELIYQRSFEIPDSWKGQRIKLNFEAVDWKTEVIVNGQPAGKHQGGFTPFSIDITDFLTDSGLQLLVVKVYDPTDASWQPRGKQVRNPGGIYYTSVTGIWGSVWMEPVSPQAHLTDVWSVAAKKEGDKFSPTLDGTVFVSGSVMRTEEASVAIKAYDQRGVMVAQLQAPVKEFGYFGSELKIDQPMLWTPDSPYLYKITLETIVHDKVVDSVESCFGIRTVALQKDDKGICRIAFNGTFQFQLGLLDQGWHPDGLYTAATDEALKFDLEIAKKMGFNMIRKHVKVESRRFYYWCDKLGILVWQDMPSGDESISQTQKDVIRSTASENNFFAEWGEIIESLRNSPSIIMWVPFNEGWGQFKTDTVVQWTKSEDSTRLVDGPSGWTDRGVGDVQDIHAYPGPQCPRPLSQRAIVLGEFGGLGLSCKDHCWKDQGTWGYETSQDSQKLTNRYAELIDLLKPMIDKGLSAAVYTQITDVESEVNGLFSYDRKVDKIGVEKVRQINDRLFLPSDSIQAKE